MMIIRPDQIARLSMAARDDLFRQLIAEVRRAHPERAGEAEAIVERATTYGTAYGFERADHLRRLVDLVARFDFPRGEGRWVALADAMLCNASTSPEARITFLVRDLEPRLEAEG